MPHLLLEADVPCDLPDVLHDELDAGLGESKGPVVLRRTVHASHRINIHVGPDQLVLTESLEIPEEPLVAQVQKAKQIVSADGAQGLDAICVQELEHEPHDARREHGLNAHHALRALLEGRHDGPARGPQVGVGPLAEQGLEVLGPGRQYASVGPYFHEARRGRRGVHAVVHGLRFALVRKRLGDPPLGPAAGGGRGAVRRGGRGGARDSARHRGRSRGTRLGRLLVDEEHAVHVLLVVQQLPHVPEELLVVGRRLRGFRLPPFSDHDGVAPLQLHGFRGVLVLEGVDEVVLQVVLPQSVVLGVVPKQGREALRFEHEA
mmetsp:Transcript_4296/g.9070  ORF Transcript_4296/g.9070 Transcript_4296/m.9070 type:complete len:319 (-) Transcript_4296:117-1073(-)